MFIFINTVDYLGVTEFSPKGSNLTNTFFTGLRSNKDVCFRIALNMPDDFDLVPENGKDIIPNGCILFWER